MALPLSPGARWVFIGDSITDCDRQRCPEGLGNGYVRLVRDWLLAREPAQAPVVVNRGISGHKVTDLRQRWRRDVLDLQPDLLSIKVGINDVWHELHAAGAGVPVDRFREVYAELIDSVRAAHPSVTLVLCEPSVIVPPAPAKGNELLQPYVQVVRELGEKYRATVVPVHSAFRAALSARPDVAWTPDGVHPGSAGHMLLARAWLAALGLL